MCGFVGICNVNKDISGNIHTLENMTHTLQKRGPDEEYFYTHKHTLLGHRRLIIIDAKNR